MAHQNHDFLKGPHEWKDGSYVAVEPVAPEVAEEATEEAPETAKPEEPASEPGAEVNTEPKAEQVPQNA